MNSKVGNINFKTEKSEWDVYFDMAMTMLAEIIKNNSNDRHTVMIVPVGPTGQYSILAKLVNQLNVSLKNVYFFNMDEYLITENEAIDQNHYMSFQKRMHDEFYSVVDSKLIMPKAQRHFPHPGKEKEYDDMIEDLGGADLCLGGLGINGHIAFNEPPEQGSNITAEEFAALGTRVLPISRETKTINAYGYKRGDLSGMPQWCITVGMKQILNSRSVYIALNRPWQHGPLKHVLFGSVQPQIPASFLQKHNNVTICAIAEIAEELEW